MDSIWFYATIISVLFIGFFCSLIWKNVTNYYMKEYGEIYFPKNKKLKSEIFFEFDNNDNIDYQVIIIGAGFSGLLSAKHFIENGMDNVLILEKRDGLGGVWYYSQNKSILTVSDKTIASSSNTVTELIDDNDHDLHFSNNNFSHHKEIRQYLINYSKKYNLHKKIKYNSKVVNVDFDENNKYWNISFLENNNDDDNDKKNSKLNTKTSRFLVICSGINTRQTPKQYEKHINSDNLIYSDQLKTDKDLIDFMTSSCRSIMVVGGGESASYCIDRLVYLQNNNNLSFKMFWSIRNGQTFMRKEGKYFNAVLDEASSGIIRLCSPFEHKYYPKIGSIWACRLFTSGNIFNYFGHGIKEWIPKYKFWHGFVNKESNVLDYVYSGIVIPKNGITNIDKNNRVTFNDNSQEQIDKIILCLGYCYDFDHEFRMNDNNYKYDLPFNCFKYTLSLNNMQLGYVGYVRPMAGSIPMMSEMSSIFLSKLWGNKLKYGINKYDLIKAHKSHLNYWKNYFKNNESRCHKSPLVDPFVHAFDLYKWIYYPYGLNYTQIFINFGFIKWLKSYFSPSHSIQIKLAEAIYLYNNNDNNKDKRSLIEIENMLSNAINIMWNRRGFKNIFWPFIITVARFLCIDQIIGFINILRLSVLNK